MDVPFFVPNFNKFSEAAVIEVMKSGWLTTGILCKKFEQEFCKVTNVKHSIGTSSCSSALILALKSLNLPVGAEVLVPSMTFLSTVSAVIQCGLTPVFVDVDYSTHNININDVKKNISRKTSVVIAVHFGGLPCDLKELSSVCRDNGLYLIEDAAHALPSSYNGGNIGSCDYSDITCFSFYSNKTLTTGEGGMITTKSSKIANYCELARSHFMDKSSWNRFDTASKNWKYDATDLGFKYNLADLNAAIGLAQLKTMISDNDKRAKIARAYNAAFCDHHAVELTASPSDRTSSNHLFQIKVQNRDELFMALKSQNISCSVHYTPVHQLSFYKSYLKPKKLLPNTEKIGDKVLSLPIFPTMTKKQVDYVIEKVIENV